MRLGVLCDDEAIFPWLEAVRGGSRHVIAAVAITSPQASERWRDQPHVRVLSQWEELLADNSLDAILVGGHAPAVLEAIKQLATAGRSLIFLPNAEQGLTYLYELGLVRDDNRVMLIPAWIHRADEAVSRARQIVHGKDHGAVRLLQFERTVRHPAPLPDSEVNTRLLCDIDLLRVIVGNYDQVTALRTGASAAGILVETVTLAGRSLPEATWFIEPTEGPDLCRLTIHSERGRSVLERDASTSEWTLIEPDGTRLVGNRVAAASRQLDQFSNAIAENHWEASGWLDLVKSFETLDATRRSVIRRRTIDLLFEPMSERSAFKSQMTAMGCGVLLLTLLLMLVYLAIASVVPTEMDEKRFAEQRQPKQVGTDVGKGDETKPSPWRVARKVLNVGRYLVFAPLAVFLGLQALYPLARPTTPATVHQDEERSDGTLAGAALKASGKRREATTQTNVEQDG